MAVMAVASSSLFAQKASGDTNQFMLIVRYKTDLRLFRGEGSGPGRGDGNRQGVSDL